MVYDGGFWEHLARSLGTFLMAVMVTLAGCGGDDGGVDTIGSKDTVVLEDSVAGVDTAGEDTVALPQVKYVTFNTGFAHNYVPLAGERIAPVVQALNALDADFVCLQEVWEDADVETLINGTKDVFPYSFQVKTEEEGSTEAACTEAESGPLYDCVVANCSETTDLTGCVLGNCGAQFTALGAGCQGCLAANLSKPLEEIFAACAQAGGSTLSYNGRNGLVLLSKHELTASDHLVLDAFLLRRVVLQARADAGSGAVDLFCTHLSAALDEVTYGGEYETWEKEQAHQIDQVLGFVTEKAAAGPAVLMGDMNCGPAIPPDISGEFPEVYDLFIQGGMTVPYPEQEGRPCTWCQANNLVPDTSTNRIIDHIMFKNLPAGASIKAAERILDTDVSVDVEGEAQSTALSDHYGVRVIVEGP